MVPPALAGPTIPEAWSIIVVCSGMSPTGSQTIA